MRLMMDIKEMVWLAPIAWLSLLIGKSLMIPGQVMHNKRGTQLCDAEMTLIYEGI